MAEATMNSPVVKRSIVIAGHKTSVSLEDAFWKAIREIALARGTTLSDLVTSIDLERGQGNLSSCLRVFVLDSCRSRISEKMMVRDAPADVMEMRPIKSAG
jgi:predicted DNA-binding ribbon-helix-helix protein